MTFSRLGAEPRMRVLSIFFQVLMDTKYKNGDPLSIEEVTGIMVCVYVFLDIREFI